MYLRRRLLVAGTALLGVATSPNPGHAQVAGSPSGLVIRISEPTDWAQAADPTMRTRGIAVRAKSSIRVAGTAKHPFGISEILLNKNRASISETPDGSTEFIGYVRVEERMTSAEITVVTKTGERLPVRYNITPIEPAKPAATPEKAWAEKVEGVGFTGKRWAVVIGISRYENKDITGLKYADADAKRFYEFLRSDFSGLGGFDEKNIQILLNEQATFKNIRVALFDFLKQATEDDVVYIYYAGHGAPDPDRLQNLYLLPYDANPTSMAGTAFSMEEMNKALREVKAAHKVLITDACHSGGVITDGTRAMSANEINTAFHSRLSSSRGVHTTFTASGPNETSRESEVWGGGHGVFTHFLIEGLKGEADANQDHLVDLREMMEYTKERVTRETGGAQTPMSGEQASNLDFPVAMVVPGTVIPEISLEEIDRIYRELNEEAEIMKFPWIKPDSAVLVAGLTDTLVVRLQNDNKDAVTPTLLQWSSSNTSVATVDRFGVVTPVAGGTVSIKAAKNERNVTTLVRVLPRPSEVIFRPAENELQLVLTESFLIESDLRIGTDQIIRDMVPKIMFARPAEDSVYLRREGAVKFVADRVGTATVTASIGGRTKEWLVRVIPPSVKIKPIPKALPVNDSFPLGAWRVRPDGTQLGDASETTLRWRSLDTMRAVVRNNQLRTRGVGKVQLVAELGSATDTVETFVLGDLLIATDGSPGRGIATISISAGNLTPLLPKSATGAQPALSPDGSQIAFVTNKRLHVMDTDGSNVRRLTPDLKGTFGVRTSSYEEHTPNWTHDGTQVVFISNAHGNYEVMSVNADGTNLQRLTKTGALERNVSTAPDIPRIAFEREASGNADIVVALVDGSQEQQLLLTKPTGPTDPGTSERKPKFVPGGGGQLVFVRRSRTSDGESLHVWNTASGSVKDLVAAQKRHSIIYAVSPDGRRIAYHMIDEWSGKKNNSIVVIDLEGTVIKTIPLGAGVEIKDIAWGASPQHAQGEK